VIHHENSAGTVAAPSPAAPRPPGVLDELEYGLQTAVEAKVLADVNGTSGIQTQAYATSVLATLRKGITKLWKGEHGPSEVCKNGIKHALHLIPAGILDSGKTCILGGGMVIDPRATAAQKERFQTGRHGRLLHPRPVNQTLQLDPLVFALRSFPKPAANRPARKSANAPSPCVPRVSSA
jgi:hypothetical protein